MKFLFFTDTHIRGTAPINRKDDFLKTLGGKLEEIMYLTKEKQVDFCLHGGDMFDRPDISPSIVRELGLILRQCPVPLYAIAGNHDIYGHNPETVKRTMLGLLDGLGIIKLLSPGQKVFLEKEGIKVQLTGQPFHYDLDRDEGRKGYLVEKETGVDYAIHLIHGLLLEKPLFPGIAYTLIENILATQADITLVGHYHRGFSKVIQIEDKFFVNPGSLVRLEASLAEIRRKPQIALLDLTREGIRIQLHRLNSPLPGLEVLDESQLSMRDYREKKIADFVQGIKEVGEFKAFDIKEIMTMIAERNGLKPQVKEGAIARIGQAQEALSAKEDFI